MAFIFPPHKLMMVNALPQVLVVNLHYKIQVMKTETQNPQPSRDELIAHYTHTCLSQGHAPHSVYVFCHEHGLEESYFYQHFASFEALEKNYLVDMFAYSLELLHQNPDYQSYEPENKLSAFYFTFIEMATANRSFVMYLFKNASLMASSAKLSALKSVFEAYALEILEKPIKIEQAQVAKFQDKALQTSAWLQFLSVLKFWMHDESPQFEKTDIFIEKSVKTSFDLAYRLPTQNLFDFAKFLWKEQVKKS
jgi:Tetracyclin repressor-like, C-terminal domain